MQITVNDKRVVVTEGATLLDAARSVGEDIPTLCYLKETGALTTCMVCVVKDASTGRLLPACTVRAVDGMAIITHDAEVHEARRAVLAMLLNEHAGDCEAPCSATCPAGLDIPRMLRYIDAGDTNAARRIAQRDLIFPGTLGRICSAPCERVCRRAQYDTCIAIRGTHADLASRPIQEAVPATGRAVAIVGAGLAGLAAAATLARAGHTCRVFEKRGQACSSVRALPPEQIPANIVDAEIDAIRALGVAIDFNSEVAPEALLNIHDTVIVACSTPFEPNLRIVVAEEEPMYVRAVANGKRAARQVDAVLCGRQDSRNKPFNSTLGVLVDDEIQRFAVERRTDSPSSEAGRCLHCDCLKRVSCKLRRYAAEYGLGPRLKRAMPRPAIEVSTRSGDVVYEPGKCIKCGICVELTRAAGVVPGMTFTGRGLDSRVRPALGSSLEQGLGSAAADCVRACPTAALAFRNAEETT